jgi:hypothetical protein
MLTLLPRHVGATLAELAHLRSCSPAADEVTIGTMVHGCHRAVVTVDGPMDGRALRLLAMQLAGLLAAGVRDLVVDVSPVGPVPDALLDLMRKVETKVLAHNGVFELTGLTPPVLHAMDDPPLAEVFAWHRAVLDDGGPLAPLWAALRCPLGLEDVPEPGSAGRHRSFIDTGAHGPGERWGRRT